MHEMDQGVFTDTESARPLTRRERAVVIARIQSLIEFWGITQDELDADTPFVASAPPGPLPIKYLHPVTGETWDGQGPHPDWLRRALLKEGMRVEELRPPGYEPAHRPGCAAALKTVHTMRLTATLLIATLLLGACTGYAPQNLPAGASLAQVTEQLGPSTGSYPLPQGGTRLEYARGPFGKHTFMVDLDSADRVTGWQQVLTENNFNTVREGTTQGELLLKLGRPSNRRGGGWQGGEVWSYRYDAIFCQWFQVSMIDGIVRAPAYGPDPICDVVERDLP